MTIWMSLTGMLRLEIVSAEPESCLQRLNQQGIGVYQVELADPLTLRLTIQRADYPRVKSICGKRGAEERVLSHLGSYWTILRLLRRPVLTLGVLAFFLLTIFLPTRVLFIRTEGNSRITEGEILEAAEECGIRFGASRRAVRSEKVKNALLEAIPALQWAGVNTTGCTAVISVRERSEGEQKQDHTGLQTIVAARDGVITSCVVTKGNGLCTVGQAVKQGQVLISPYTDCGISIRAEDAQGEIFAQTRRQMEAVTPTEYALRLEPGEQQRSYSLIVGKKRINLWKDSGIWDGTCDRMYAEYYITLPGGLKLPIRIAVETFTPWTVEPREEIRKALEPGLREFSARYILRRMVSGEITEAVTAFHQEPGRLILTGQYLCREMIGREIEQKIGEYNG